MDKRPLGDVLSLTMGQSPPGTSCNGSGIGTPLLNGPTEFGSRCPTPAQWTTDARRVCDNDAVLLCVRGSTTGRTNRADQPYAIGRGVAAIEAIDSIDQSFAFFSLLGSIPSLLERTTGSVFPNLSRDDISSIELAWPDRRTRGAIAEVLGALDDKIDANRRTIAAALAFAIQCVQSAIRDVQLSDVTSIKRNTLSPSSFSGEEVDHFSLPAFDDDQVPVRELGSNIKSGKQEVTNTLVLVSKLNPHIPRIWYATAQPGVRAVASTEFVCLQARGDVTAEELWASCSAREFTEQLQERVTGTTGSHQRVRPEDMMTVTIADPTTLSEATRSALRKAVALGEALRHETPIIASLRDALLPKLMSGELRVRDAEHLVEDAV